MSDLSKSLDVLSPAKRALFERLLADRARERRGLAGRAGGISPRPAGLSTLPLSYAQQRLWFLDRLESGNPAYLIPIAVRLRGALDVRVLRASLLAVIGRHEALRTTFDEAAGQPFQVIHPEASLPWAEADLRTLGEAREEESRRVVLAEARRSFDLRVGPLLRGLLLRLDERDHVLLLTIHHIVFDGWSISLLIRELDTLYRAALVGETPDLPPLPIQYADFALWQRRWEEKGGLDAQLAYWRNQLAGADDLLPLPADRPRPSVQTYAGATCIGLLGPDLARRLRRLAREEGTTLFVVLLAGFQALLHRLTGSLPISVGTPIANRNHVETDEVIGFFVNTLVMRVEVSGGLRFRELVGRVREIALGAYAHQDLPFEKLVEILQPRRDLSRPPLFQVLLGFRNTPKATFSLPGLEVELVPLETRVAQFDLMLSMSEDGDTVLTDLVYNVDLFDPPTAGRILGYFSSLLAAAACGSEEWLVGEILLLTAAEMHQVLREWNDTGAVYPGGGSPLQGLIAAQAARSPDRTALIFDGESLTYAELDARANQLAHHLIHLGIGPESLVGLALERSFEMVVGILAILKAGGAYVPFEPHGPAERLALMVGDAQVEVLLAQERWIAKLPQTDVPVVCLDTGWPEVMRHPASAPAVPVEADQLAYVIFTSGSTGRPKGAMNTHRGVCNRLLWMQETYALTAADRVLQKTPYSFDVSVWELFWPLLTGACLVIARPEGHQDPAYLARTIEAEEITTLHFVPSMLQAFLEEDLGACIGLRRVICSGEALSPELARRFSARLGERAELHNLYGPTEAAVDVTAWACPAGAELRSVPIGCPIGNLRIHILDGGQRTVPIGVAGELLIGGVGLARGYLRRPDLTAERFIPDPFGPAGSRLYRTGDLARRLASGVIEFLGRIDQQVKIRGVRIELGEVEAALERHPCIRMAAVLARPDSTGSSTLMACIVAEGPAPGIAELREFLRGKLPEIMVPALFAFVEALPLNANGKLDRRALARIEPEAASSRSTFEAPRTRVEEILTKLWQEVLGLDRIGVSESFFDLGGHSLRATQVGSRVREELGVDLPVRELFEAPTVALLAARIERARGSIPQAPSIVPVPREGELPLSFAQQRLWFIDQLEPDSPLYNMPVALRVRGPLRGDALARSLSEIQRRHEALRTVFASTHGDPVQIVLPLAEFRLATVDLSSLPEEARERRMLELVVEESGRPFDLSREPLWRGSLIRLTPREHVVVLVVHHIVSDGWSMGVLVRELRALYPAFAVGEPSPLPELPVQYADYAVWQQRWLQGEVLDRELGYWRGQLAGSPPVLELPADRPRLSIQTFRGAHCHLELPSGIVERLRAIGRRQGATLFMSLLAGFSMLLARLTGREDLSVGSPIAGREHKELEPLIGFFANTLVLRVDLSGDPGFEEALARVREVSLAAYMHQEVPFEKLVEELAPERSLAYSPLFQVLMVLQNAPREEMRVQELEMESLRLPGTTAKFDLVLSLEEGPASVSGALEYNVDLFDAVTMARLLAHFETLLSAAIGHPEARLSALPLLGEVVQALLLREWNDTAAPLEPAAAHERVGMQAARTPERRAIVWPGGRWTYAELNARADRLANHLLSIGVLLGDLVGVCVERGPELGVAVLAVLKAGGAYLPIDPNYPRERLDFLLEDSGVRLVLIQERLLPVMAGRSVRAVLVDKVSAEVEVGAPAAPQVRIEEGSPAYVIYTSGSTGRPKGIVLPHRTLSNLVSWQIATSPRTAAAATLQLASPSFDVSLQEMFTTWCAGGTLIIAPEEARRDSERLAQYLAEQSVERLFAPFVVLQQLAEYLTGEEGRELPVSLREVVTAGERLQITPQLATLFSRLSGCPLRNQYGPSESHAVTELVLAGDPAAWPSLPSIGRPIANAETFLLDHWLQPTAIGVPGELAVGGAGLALGYWGRPGLTAEKFIPDPFSRTPGARLYRTGDLARWRSDGELEFLGRIDHQVKVRGFRIELGEIEAVLGELAGVREAVVVAREALPANQQLVAYVVGKVVAETLRETLRDRLPEYMVPSAFVMLEALPLTPNGKVDRQSLPAPQWQGPPEGHVASRTPMEEVLEGIWAEILGVERVGVKESFFALGGHSLLATRVMSRVRRVFGVELPLRDLFEEPTVAGLAARIEAALRGGAAAAPPIMLVPRTGPLPLSFGQQRLWLIDQLEPDNPLYNLSMALRASGPLDTMALARSLGEIVRRHEALRTVFTAVDGEPVQVVRLPGPFLLPVVDLSALPKTPREALALALTAEEARRPFNLSQGPLFRVSLLRMGPEDHMALVTMHHIVGDGWSLGILVREVTALYTAHEEDRLSPLPELRVQYADFAVWQRSWLQGEVLEGEIAYWRGQLAGLPAVLELPADRPRPAVQSFRGAVRPVRFSAELTRRVQALGRREGATPFMVLLSGFMVLLSRHSGHSDLVVGSPVAGRNRMEIEDLIGFFVNTLVLRGDLSGEPSFAELLGRVRETALAAQVHQDLPFDRLVEGLAPERSLAHTPLFQAMFALQNAPVASLDIENLRLRPVDVAATTAKFDLMLSLSEQGGGLLGTVEYATDLYDAATVDRLILQLERLLAAALGEPDRPVAGLPLLGGAELQQVLREWNDTGVEHGVLPLLHLLIAEQAARMPGRVAVEQGSRALTAGELETRAEWLARLLRRWGLRIEDRVAVCCERSPEMVVILLAVWKAGAAWLPLEPSYPAARLAAVLDDARPALLITGPGAPRDLPSAGTVQHLDLAVAERELAADSGPLEVAVTPDHLAYAIYTSGSTGRPKGVLVSHGAIANHMLWMQRRFPLGEDDAVLQKTPFVFDAAIWEIFLPLLAGARLVLAPPGAHREPAAMARELRARGVTVLQLVPSVLGPFLDEDLRDLPLQRLFCGGEALPVTLCERVLDLLPGIDLCNLYGPTECTIDATFHPCRPGMKEAIAPLGRPVDNLWVRILDRWGQPMAPGQSGELCLGGAGLARGYLGRPDLTAERFVPDPCATKPGARLYCTGDLVRQRADGTIHFLGRIDHQVKIRGLRIELGDVEAALSALPGVRQVVVMPREDRLVAWVAGDVDADRLRRELRERLPEAMVPNAFVILAELPVTPTGKVDRKALPAPQPLAAVSGYAAPRTREEQILAEIWAQTLRLPRVGVNDNFFELGGDSILSVQIVARARQAGLSFTMRQIFEHQTVAALARHAVLETTSTVRAEQGSVAGEVTLTPIQRWFFEQGFADPHHFNQALLLETREPLSPAALESAMAAIVEHHDALRLRFASRAGNWRQENAPAEPVAPFHLVDLSALPAPRRVQALAPAAAALQAGFNLSAGPLTRLCLFEAGAGQPSQLLWVSHHLVVDGVSWRVLLEDLERAYRQAARGQRPGFPPKTTSFQEWARRLAAHAGSDAVADELEHWREIAEVPVPRLPVDFPSGGNLVGDEATVSFELSTEETADLLQTLPSVYHNRIDDALLSSLGRALAGWIGSPWLRLDLEGHGREPLFDDLDLSRTVGWFTSLYPVVLEAGDAGPDAALVSAKDRLRAVPGRGIGHGLLRHLGKTAFLEEAPSAEILFNYLGQVDGTLDQLSFFRASTASAGPGRSPRAHRAYLLAIDGIVTEGRLRMALTYGSRVHRRETMERLAAAYADTLRQLIQHGRDSREVFMASGLEEEGRLLWSPLVPIQPLGDRAPLFCIHALGGEVLYYYRLARELGTDQPLYGLQARPMDGQAGQSPAPQITIEELAAEYLRAVRSLQPVGPYFLAGHSFGGVVAFEMARQLTASGEDVALLALLDQPVSAGDEVAEVDTAAVIADLVQSLAQGQGRTVELDADALRGLPIDRQLARGLEVLGSMEALGPGFDIPMLRGLALGWSSRATAVERYRVSAYPGRITLLRASDVDLAAFRELSPERRRIYEDPTMGWGAVAAAGVEVHSVPGNHQTILEAPHVETLAGILRACIERARREAGANSSQHENNSSAVEICHISIPG